MVILPSVSLQVVVSPNNGGGTTSTPKSEDVILFDSNSKVIGAYKYSILFCIKRHESVINILKFWGDKSIVKVLRVLLSF